MGKYFGTDGFRGRAGVQITALHAYRVGAILGHIFAKKTGKCRAVIGKDTRLSSYMLEYALAAGLTSSGADAYILHVTTTASVSLITRIDGFDCGIMISASHNPYYDNGIKILNANGEKLEDSVIEIIERHLDSPDPLPLASGKDIGRTVDYISGRNRYIGHLISLSTCSYKGLKIGIDAANGSGWQIARSVFDALGAKTFVTGCEPDGTNVNSGVGSTHIENLVGLVKDNSLDIGFAFDGDADRCICVDSCGNVITGDEELYILANYLKARGELANDCIVCTNMSNGGLISGLRQRGICCEISPVGDRNVWDKMVKCGAALGGERSGHIVLSKCETTGDGLVTAIMIMEAVVEGKCPVQQLLRGYKSLAQAMINVEVKSKDLGGIAYSATEIGAKYGVRTVVRPSGTEPLVRIMAEGENYDSCAKACEEIAQLLKKGGLCAE